jgi:hypothetical protein
MLSPAASPAAFGAVFKIWYIAPGSSTDTPDMTPIKANSTINFMVTRLLM